MMTAGSCNISRPSESNGVMRNDRLERTCRLLISKTIAMSRRPLACFIVMSSTLTPLAVTLFCACVGSAKSSVQQARSRYLVICFIAVGF